MASNRDTSNGPDEVDITTFMAAFQGINNIRVEVELMVEDRGPSSVMVVQATAWPKVDELSDPPPLVLLSVRSTLGIKQTLPAAILQLLYVLDGRLAGLELSGRSKTA